MNHPYRRVMQPWTELATLARSLKVASGLCLHYYDAGAIKAPAAILIHGLGDDADTWRHVIPSLAQTHRVIAPDLPGFGRSDKPHRAYTIRFLATTILQLIEQLSLNEVVIIANSLGALMAAILAIEHPRCVSKLILVDGPPALQSQKVEPAMLLGLLPVIGELGYNRLRNDPHMAYESLRAYYADLDHLPQSERDFLFQRVNERVWDDGQRHAYLSVLRWMAWWMMRDGRAFTARLTQLPSPVLIVWGEQDHILSMDHARALHALLPGAQTVTIAKAGHVPHQEQPVDFLRAVTGYMAQ